jgi:hypothetical protein
MKVRIYEGADAGPDARPVATVTIGTSPGPDLGPSHVEPSARFFLEAIETSDPAVRQRLKEALTRETVPISRALVSQRGAVRTRGDTTVPEPHGTPAYWRAALGRLAFEKHLSCDPGDYRSLLEWVGPPLMASAVAPARVAATPKSPFELSPQVLMQFIALLDSLLMPPKPQPVVVRTRGGVRAQGTSRPDQELLELLRRELETNPDFLRATANLRLALSLPEEDREKLLAELESLSKKSKSHEPRPE